MFSAFTFFICVNLSPSAVEKIQIETPCLTALGLPAIACEMKKRWAVVIFFAGSLLGGLIGYSSRPEQSKFGFITEIALENPRDRKMQAGANTIPQRWLSLAKQATTFSDEERTNFLKQLAPTDRGKALDALMSQVGPGSTSDQVTSTMSQILDWWAEKDFEEALAHCRKCSNDGMRKYLLGQLINFLAEKDLDRAIQLLAEQKTEDPLFECNLIFTLASEKMGEKANRLLDLLSKLPMTSGSTGTDVDFSHDYDFKAAANGIMAMIKANPGKTPTVLPTNLFESWAARDPDAAQVWWVKNGSFAFNNWSSLLNGVEKHSTPEAASAWVVTKLEEPGAPREKMIRELAAYSGSDVAGKINTIARAMPDIATQDRFLTDVILTNWDPLSSRFRFAISGLSSPQTRLAAFQKIATTNQGIFLGEIDEAQFQAWGLTRQQVELICKPK